MKKILIIINFTCSYQGLIPIIIFYEKFNVMKHNKNNYYFNNFISLSSITANSLK